MTIELRKSLPIAALVLCALLLRPGGWTAFAVTAAAGISGLVVPVARGARRVPFVVAVAVGCAAFALARWATMLAPSPVGRTAVVVTILAAVAEEAFFRRLLYTTLQRWGDAIAITGAAVAFALVHVPAYGSSSIPINLAAGLLFGWQRWASGSWAAPAATHVFANLVQSW